MVIDGRAGLPEIVDAYERDARLYAVVRVVLEDRPRAFEFRVKPTGYRALRRILLSRPFVAAGRGRYGYRYFFVPRARRVRAAPARFEFPVLIEQAGDRAEIPFEAPRELLSNFLWFAELRRLEDASDLKSVEPRAEA